MTDIVKDSKNNKILFLSPYLPYPPDDGIKLRAFHIIREMLRLNYDVSLICFVDNDEKENIKKFKEDFNISVTTIPLKRRIPSSLTRIFISLFSKYPFLPSYYYKESLFKKTLGKVARDNFDLLYVYDPSLVLFGLDLDMLMILDSIDCQADSAKNGFDIAKNPFHKLYWYMNYVKWKKVEKKIYTQYDKVITTARRDENSLKCIDGLKVSAIGNGIDYSYFKPLNLTKIPYSLLFMGNMECFSNSDAILYFIKEIYPILKEKIPNIKLLIVGKAPSKISSFNDDHNIIFLGYVDDVRTYIDQCEIVICPVRMATGIQTKVLASMSMNKPIVSTKLAVGDIYNFINENDILIADDKYHFAQIITQLFTNTELLSTIGKNGRDIIIQNFSWESSGDKLDYIIKRLLKYK